MTLGASVPGKYSPGGGRRSPVGYIHLQPRYQQSFTSAEFSRNSWLRALRSTASASANSSMGGSWAAATCAASVTPVRMPEARDAVRSSAALALAARHAWNSGCMSGSEQNALAKSAAVLVAAASARCASSAPRAADGSADADQ